jgi:hypothetical protein
VTAGKDPALTEAVNELNRGNISNAQSPISNLEHPYPDIFFNSSAGINKDIETRMFQIADRQLRIAVQLFPNWSYLHRSAATVPRLQFRPYSFSCGFGSC